ncbi:MAG: hypothetical protein KGI30_04840, partial [Planctomycetota bacterium]|nr:hypothetical protein [Planctomycetota bacterium]
LPFIILVQIINESWTKDYLLKISIGMFIFLFCAILLRQGCCYCHISPNKTVPIDLKISMCVDIFGIVMSVIAYLYPKAIRFWSHLGLGSFICYFAVTRLITLSVKLQ